MDSGGVALGTPVEQPSQAFVPQELHRYKTVQEEITNLTNEQVVSKLYSSSAAVQQLTTTLNAEKQSLRDVMQAEQKEEKLVDEYTNHWGCQAFFLGQRRQQAKIAQHTELLKQREAQHQAGAERIGELEKTLAHAQQDQAKWQGKVNQLQALQTEDGSLLTAMFSRPPWTADATLAPMVSQAASLSSQAASAQQTAGIYRAAKGELGTALNLCNQAVSLLQQAGWLGHFEMGMDFGSAIFDPRFGLERRGGFGEVIQLMEIQQAQELVQGAAQQINKARSILPSVPYINEAIVHSCMTGIFADILVGNFMSEMIIVQQVHASMARVGRMMQEVQQCSNWCAQNQAAFEGQQSSLAAAAAAKTAEVVCFKKQQIQAALASQAVV